MATMFTAIENNPIVVDLVALANTTGWSLPGDGTAVHTSCNTGALTQLDYTIIPGHTYTITLDILSISGGSFGIALVVGNNNLTTHNSPGVVVETIPALDNTPVQIYSDANCVITSFAIQDTTTPDPLTLVYATKNKKWSDFRTLYPEFGVSLNEKTILSNEGSIYVQENGSQLDRNNFFGTQYTSIFSFVEAKDPELLKTYNSIVIQANQVFVTTPNGITTSLGQVSELAEIDFIKGFLSDGVSSAVVEAVEGVYSASFLRDKNDDLQNGAQLKGNYIIITLTKANPYTPVKIFSIAVNSSQSKIGAR